MTDNKKKKERGMTFPEIGNNAAEIMRGLDKIKDLTELEPISAKIKVEIDVSVEDEKLFGKDIVRTGKMIFDINYNKKPTPSLTEKVYAKIASALNSLEMIDAEKISAALSNSEENYFYNIESKKWEVGTFK